MKRIHKSYDVVIVGGGMSGLIAAISAARKGVNCALIHNRPVLGGNASSEIRMHICGADNHGHRENARETGILEEILLENKYRNPNHSYAIFDSILWEKAHFQANLDLYLNTHFTNVSVVDQRIEWVEVCQLTTETTYQLHAQGFVDATGDGSLAALSGANYMVGRESQDTYHEPHAPEVADSICMGNTLLFSTIERPYPVTFIKPYWANTYTEEDLNGREHGAHGHNYWWIELGGDDLDTIYDSELIRNDLLKAVYGVWDHIKNSGQHHAENYDLDWVGYLPGKRESRRILGDYVLNENDLMHNHPFEDAVAYGGWPMDMHVPGGLKTKLEPTEFIKVPDVYSIPYRSLYSKDIQNLWLAGRIISASHMAFGSTRVMGTCSVVGQAVGTALGLIKRNQWPYHNRINDIRALQMALLLDDAYIPNIKFSHDADLAPQAILFASDALIDSPVSNVVNGYTRPIKQATNRWSAACSMESPAYIDFKYKSPVTIGYIDMKFDSNLSKQISISMFHNGLLDDTGSIPETLIKDYTLSFYDNESLIYEYPVKNNYVRHQKIHLPQLVTCTQLRITPHQTHGIDEYRIFAISLFTEYPY